jgi:phospholipid/cholesterol/gamma-HCH transport system substrate-binding protein
MMTGAAGGEGTTAQRKDSAMNEKTRNVAVGLTAAVALAGAALILMLFGYVPALVEGGYELRVSMANAGGLAPGSVIRLSGIEVGRVKSIHLVDSPPETVVARVRIKSGVRIPKDAQARTESTLLGGSFTLAMDVAPLPPGEKREYLPTDGSAVIAADTSTLTASIQGALLKTQTQFEQLAKDFAKVSHQLADDFSDVTKSFHELSGQWTSVGKNVNTMLEPHTPAQVDAGQAVGNLSSALARLDGGLKLMQQTLDGINQYVNDDAMRKDVRQTLANARQFTEKAAATAERLQVTVDNAGKNVDRLTTRYLSVADDLSGAVTSMRKAVDQARDGDGTLGKLLRDPHLYDNLNDAAQRLNEAITEFKLLLQKVKKEGLPVQF